MNKHTALQFIESEAHYLRNFERDVMDAICHIGYGADPIEVLHNMKDRLKTRQEQLDMKHRDLLAL